MKITIDLSDNYAVAFEVIAKAHGYLSIEQAAKCILNDHIGLVLHQGYDLLDDDEEKAMAIAHELSKKYGIPSPGSTG